MRDHFPRWRLIATLLAVILVAAGCSETASAGPMVELSGTSELHHRHQGFPHYIGHFEASISETVPHDRSSFTQGLEWHDGDLIESTGIRGQSALIRVDPMSGEEERRVDLDENHFGEGLTIFSNRVYQLTWQAETVLIYDVNTLTQTGSFSFEGEGWGLCYSDSEDMFVMSNGTSQLTVRDAKDFSVVRPIDVSLEGEPVAGLNELECSGDQIWANILDYENLESSNTVVAINSSSGEVEATVDASNIVPESLTNEDQVLNGIALRPEDASLWLTGKEWPVIYRVRLEPVAIEEN